MCININICFLVCFSCKDYTIVFSILFQSDMHLWANKAMWPVAHDETLHEWIGSWIVPWQMASCPKTKTHWGWFCLGDIFLVLAVLSKPFTNILNVLMSIIRRVFLKVTKDIKNWRTFNMSKEFTLWCFRKLIQNSIPPHEILVASNNQIFVSWIAILVLHSPPTPPQTKKTSRSRVVTRIQSDLLKPHNFQIIRWLRWPFRTTFSGSQFITCGTPTWIATRLLAHGVLVRQET